MYIFVHFYSWWTITKQKPQIGFSKFLAISSVWLGSSTSQEDYFLDNLPHSDVPISHTLFSMTNHSCWPHPVFSLPLSSPQQTNNPVQITSIYFFTTFIMRGVSFLLPKASLPRVLCMALSIQKVCLYGYLQPNIFPSYSIRHFC